VRLRKQLLFLFLFQAPVKPDYTSTSRGGRQALKNLSLRTIPHNIEPHITDMCDGIDQPIDSLVAVEAADEEKSQRPEANKHLRTLGMRSLESHAFLALTQAARQDQDSLSWYPFAL
jgi:hypothetical protein